MLKICSGLFAAVLFLLGAPPSHASTSGPWQLVAVIQPLTPGSGCPQCVDLSAHDKTIYGATAKVFFLSQYSGQVQCWQDSGEPMGMREFQVLTRDCVPGSWKAGDDLPPLN